MQLVQKFLTKCQFLIDYGEEVGDFMPWHTTNNPAKVLTAEIFLRRTTRIIAQKLYKDFFVSFSGINEINERHRKELVEILKPGGLYNQRADQFIKLADELRSRGLSEIPNDYNTLKSLSGVGQYSAEAVLLYAFRQPYFPLDGGIHRVIRRLINQPVSKGDTDLRSTKRIQYSKDKVVQTVKSLLQEKYEGIDLEKIHKAMLKISWNWCLEKPACEACKANNICEYYSNNF